jgi:RimJ/RimL family protein N-acetyltransferase
MQMSQVEICALESNVAALNLYEKVGFKRTDFLSDNMVIDGKLQGSHVLKMQRRDYLFFDKQCPLEGILTKLIPLKINDLEALYAVASDPLIWEMHPQKSRYQKEVFEKFFNDAIDSKGAYLIIEKSSSAIIGNTRFYEYSPIKKNISIGFTFLARSHWAVSIIVKSKISCLNMPLKPSTQLLLELALKFPLSKSATKYWSKIFSQL